MSTWGRYRAATASLALLLAAPANAQSVPSPNAAAISAQSAEQSAEALRLAHEIVEIAFPAGQRDSIMRQLLDTMAQQMREGMGSQGQDPGLKAILTRYLASIPDEISPVVNAHMPAILDATAIAYSHEFTLEELRAIRSFAGTEAGNHMLSRGTALLSDPAITAANRDYFRDLNALSTRMTARLRREITAFLQSRQDK